MKIKFIFILFVYFMFISCDGEHKNASYNTYDDIYEEIYCPECNGIGEVKMTTSDKVVYGILSFGPGALCDTKQCEMCKGTGIVKRRKLNYD